MRVKLKVTQGAQAGREVPISVSEFVIGRGEECHLRPRSDAISRRHCVITVGEKQVVVRDLGSKNGSYVNGERVEGERVVQAGDQFMVGPLEFEFVIEHVLGGAKRPAARDVKEVAARTAASSTEDLDIAHWLEEDDDTDTSRAVATPETRQFRVDDTSNLALETSVGGRAATGDTQSTQDSKSTAEHPKTESEATVENESPDSEDPKVDNADESAKGKKSGDRWKKNEPGKLPPRPTISSKDSREAAADMLKRFFNRG